MLAVQRQLISVGFNLADESEAAFGMVSVLREQMLFRTLRSRSDRRLSKDAGRPATSTVAQKNLWRRPEVV